MCRGMYRKVRERTHERKRRERRERRKGGGGREGSLTKTYKWEGIKRENQTLYMYS